MYSLSEITRRRDNFIDIMWLGSGKKVVVYGLFKCYKEPVWFRLNRKLQDKFKNVCKDFQLVDK